MDGFRSAIVALVVVGFTPGLAEVVAEPARSLQGAGVAEPFEHAPDEATGTEHGCSGVTHRCQCCGVTLLPPPAVPSVLPPSGARWKAAVPLQRVTQAHVRGIQRPPSA
ncbi:MAG: hypothetical protein ACODAU_01450 [Myxococcota bacterium]